MKKQPLSSTIFDHAYSSPFRWAGSKRKSLAPLAEFWQEGCHRYVEPFCGSAALFFRLAPKQALLGDINAELMHAFCAIRTHPEAVHSLAVAYPRTRETYNALRAEDPRRLSPLKRAARFVYLNRLCFNGLYRTNLDGGFNVPFGGKKTGAFPSLQDFYTFSEQLKCATLLCSDFDDVLRKVVAGDFVYLDPPYHLQKRRTFRQYDSTDFDFGGIWKLRMWLEHFAELRIRFALTYAESDEGRFLAQGFCTRKLFITRNIAGFVANRRKYGELLIYPSYAANEN